MKRKGGLLKKIGIAFIVLLIISAVFGRRGSSSAADSSGSSKVEATQVQAVEPEPAPEPEQEPEPAPEPESEPETPDETYVRPEFAQSMQDYEAFMRSYVDYMKKMQEDPTSAEVLLGGADLLAKEAEYTRSFESWEEGDLTAAELSLYMETQAHVMEMLAEVM